MHSHHELERICESQYETIRKLMNIVDGCEKSLIHVRDFDGDTEEVFDDPGHISKIQLIIIKLKLTELN